MNEKFIIKTLTPTLQTVFFSILSDLNYYFETISERKEPVRNNCNVSTLTFPMLGSTFRLFLKASHQSVKNFLLFSDESFIVNIVRIKSIILVVLTTQPTVLYTCYTCALLAVSALVLWLCITLVQYEWQRLYWIP